MTLMAVIIGDYCSEYMPTWYCWLFSVKTVLPVGGAVLAILATTQFARGMRSLGDR